MLSPVAEQQSVLCHRWNCTRPDSGYQLARFVMLHSALYIERHRDLFDSVGYSG